MAPSSSGSRPAPRARPCRAARRCRISASSCRTATPNSTLMGQKTNPIGFRLAVRRDWQSRWFASKKEFPKLLKEDQLIRTTLMEKLKQASVPRIFIERASSRVRVKIYTARPGIVIGRKGQEVENIKAHLMKLTGKEILLDIQEVKKPEIEAQLVA